MTKIGVSVPFGLFTGAQKGDAAAFSNAFGGVDRFLDYCGKSFDAAELRTVKSDSDPCVVLNAVKALKQRGLMVTIHATLGEVASFFDPYRMLLDAGLQSNYNLTVHPAKTAEETERMLRDICTEADSKEYPILITLENQRIKKGRDYGTCAHVAEIAKRIPSPRLALCFDFGHQLSNESIGVCDEISPDFLDRVRHTHVHSMYTRTHYPLDCGECRLEDNLTALLTRDYDGVLSLELSPERYVGELDVRSSLEHSADILHTAAVQTCTKLESLAFYQKDYASVIKDLRRRFDTAGDCVALLSHAAYAIKLGDVRIAVDLAPRRMPIDAATRAMLLEWLSTFDAFILTHAHADHYDPDFIAELPAGIKKLIPDFIPLEVDGRIDLHADSQVEMGDVTLQFFESAHVKVPEYGFAIEYHGEALVFPTDVRDYAHAHFIPTRTRALFAHLWLGYGAALKSYEQCIDAFCAFVNSFGDCECYVAHLLETGRKITDLWSDVHFDKIKKRLPNAKKFIIGELIKL